MTKIEYQIGINERLMKKYNAIVNFLEKNKNKEVVFENGCLNTIIKDVEYRRENIRGTFKTQDSIVFILDNNKYYEVENARAISIDRKYKTIYFNRFMIF